jgi:putative ABC transport system permease protein
MTRTTVFSGIGMALDTIRGHKLRAFLTVLGVIIGTGAVIGVGSILAGLDGAITNIFRSFGPTTLIVFKFKIGVRSGHLTPEEMRRKSLTYENSLAIAERCPSVAHVTPYLFADWHMINRARYKGNDIFQVDIGGTEEAYAAGGTVMKFGRFFTDAESRHRMPVVVIGEDVQKAFFPSTDPVGKWIEVNGHQFEIVGAMQRPAFSFPGSEDLRILFPYFTMHKMFPNAHENMLVVIAKPGMMAQAADEVRTVMRIERRVPNNQADNFSISSSEQLVEDFHKVTAMVALVIVVLSSIGLLVGGIGVMNIMLVSVTERTREIGIRKAIGARRSDIILQFLTEAVVLTVLGGMLGMFFGWLVSLVARLVFPSLPTAVPMWAAVLGVAVSVGVGLFFGIWPATRAARLDPVVALRYE